MVQLATGFSARRNSYEGRNLLVCKFGGADGVRTHDLLDAIEARSQLRHGPTDVLL